MKEKRLVGKSNISNVVKGSNLNTKLATLAIKAELKAEQNKIVKLEVLDSNYFLGKSHFEDASKQIFFSVSASF